VSLLFAGVDDHRSSLIATDPSGSYRGYKATAIGRNSNKAKKVLSDQYRYEITLDEAIGLAIEALKEASVDDLSPNGINIAVISVETKVFKTLSEVEIQKYF
jgi:20S proteasome alpha/beta subunit